MLDQQKSKWRSSMGGTIEPLQLLPCIGHSPASSHGSRSNLDNVHVFSLDGNTKFWLFVPFGAVLALRGFWSQIWACLGLWEPNFVFVEEPNVVFVLCYLSLVMFWNQISAFLCLSGAKFCKVVFCALTSRIYGPFGSFEALEVICYFLCLWEENSCSFGAKSWLFYLLEPNLVPLKPSEPNLGWLLKPNFGLLRFGALLAFLCFWS